MIEIIIFGKGYGESILLRIENKWFVIDSFLDPKSKVPIAVKYLSDNGYDIEDIYGIICTHWDNDHVVGISHIIEQHSEGVSLCLPIAYNDIRFTEYVTFYSNGQNDKTSEFVNILKLLEKKKVNRLYAISDRNLFQKEISDPDVCIRVLSPNDNQYTSFLNSIILPQKGEKKKRISFEENKISIVTYIKSFVDAILLGGDMENSSDGWESICRGFIDDKCRVFKVPHHGSENGYHEKVWNTMVDRPISIITRFNICHLPTDEMLETIAKESTEVYVVGPEPKKDRSTIRQIKKYGSNSVVQSISMLDYDYGYVKLSKSRNDSEWSIETYGAVKKYEQ